ncbi:MAG: hypothetical protein HW380_290 [Magnetococcales bacterium]|nr:hypothetical protein [Magnetococcales bacterium]HIJ82931.1 hypothetical protein [Magnetococcales bacterium]
MIHLLPSADYEYYLGGNFLREEQVLLEPTDRLLSLYESLGLKITLFCDVACIWRYREWGEENIASQMEQQMRDALSRGHDVQAHLHPHWLKTERAGRRYEFRKEDYLLGTLDANAERCQAAMEHILGRSAAYLNDLLQPVDPEYRCVAFRAGGYGLQPREKMVIAALIKAGFAIDSSIIPGFIYRSSTHQVDFSTAPRLANYWLDPQNGLAQPAPEGTGIYEIPIASMQLTPMQSWGVNLPEALRQAMAILTGQDGATAHRGEPCDTPPQDTKASRWHRAYWRSRSLLQTRFHRLEAGPSLHLLRTTLDRYLQNLPATQPVIHLSLNSHPKGMTQHHLDVLKRFHRETNQRHPNTLRCITFREAWQQMTSEI